MNNDETKLKAECWDILYPALILWHATGGLLPINAAEDLTRALKHYQSFVEKEADDF